MKHFIVCVLGYDAPSSRFTHSSFQIEDTIEGRILEIQKRKTALVKEAFRGKSASGSTDPESLENLKIMFGKA